MSEVSDCKHVKTREALCNKIITLPIGSPYYVRTGLAKTDNGGPDGRPISFHSSSWRISPLLLPASDVPFRSHPRSYLV